MSPQRVNLDPRPLCEPSSPSSKRPNALRAATRAIFDRGPRCALRATRTLREETAMWSTLSAAASFVPWELVGRIALAVIREIVR